MLKIVETCDRCTDIAEALRNEADDCVAVQGRTEIIDQVPSRCGSSATAAIVAAAASAAGFQLEANGTELKPCLDCLEEFVRRKRVEKRESHEAYVDEVENEETEVITAATTTTRLSTTEISVPKRRSSIYGAAGGSKAASAASDFAKSSTRRDSFSISPQSPSPYRCPMCNACKSCGHTPPPGRK
ncbi:hypothetical protein V5799_010790 [Amblyomma americanum]|uniref:Uncharacterized protein n=1 Tax=Amblyomma americanum TaxID=6943 RepID=A0AAQ4EJ76_AMBAM